MKSFNRWYDETSNNEPNPDSGWSVQLVHSSQLHPLSDELQKEPEYDDQN